jgi:hypothetical protein
VRPGHLAHASATVSRANLVSLSLQSARVVQGELAAMPESLARAQTRTRTTHIKKSHSCDASPLPFHRVEGGLPPTPRAEKDHQNVSILRAPDGTDLPLEDTPFLVASDEFSTCMADEIASGAQEK